MTQRTWVILGATSIIAEQFAQLAAQEGHSLYLVGRQEEQLHLIANDLHLRFQVVCTVFVVDMLSSVDEFIHEIKKSEQELDLFIAHSDFTDNNHLNQQTIPQLIKTNIESTTLLIHEYWSKPQSAHHLIYLSSVAACRGRAKNSLYGASKACIEVYLQGLQQTATKNQYICIVRLGFIDTKQTYGLPGIFYAGAPKACAQACFQALRRKKRLVYFPFFWRAIMAVMTRLPFFIYRKMNGV